MFRFERSRWLTTAALIVLASGCDTLDESGVPGMSNFIDRSDERRQLAEMRDQYQRDRSPEALQWLMRHHVRTGMSPSAISEILGEAGQPEPASSPVLKQGAFRQGDAVYRWGPDAESRSIFLVFRNDRLINYDPQSASSLFDGGN